MPLENEYHGKEWGVDLLLNEFPRIAVSRLRNNSILVLERDHPVGWGKSGYREITIQTQEPLPDLDTSKWILIESVDKPVDIYDHREQNRFKIEIHPMGETTLIDYDSLMTKFEADDLIFKSLIGLRLLDLYFSIDPIKRITYSSRIVDERFNLSDPGFMDDLKLMLELIRRRF